MSFIIEHGDNKYKHNTLREVLDKIYDLIVNSADITRLYIEIEYLDNMAIIRGIPDNEEALIILDPNSKQDYNIKIDDKIELENLLQKILLQKNKSWRQKLLWILILLAIIAIIVAGAIYIKK
jgi:hypothetical protein